MTPSCIGNGEYAARIVRRRTTAGRPRALGELPTLESGIWSRAPQATTDASVVVALQAEGCVDVLHQTLPWWDELELYRQSGMTDDLVWAGPIIDVIAAPGEGTATVTAKDLSAWWSKRVCLTDRTWTATDLATIFAALVTEAFAIDNPGIDVVTTPSGIAGDRIIAGADRRRLDNELAELARTGVDWTTTGRRFWIGATAGRLPVRLTDEAFRVPPQTRRTGADLVNDAYVRGNAVQGHYGGPDPFDGVLLQDVRDEQSIIDTPTANAAARTWWDRGHEPATYLEGDNQLEPDAPIDVQTLIPGVLAAVDVSGGGVVPYRGDLRLEGVRASFGPEGEEITVSLQPVGSIVGAS